MDTGGFSIRWPRQGKPSPLLEVLDYLLVNQAPSNDYDIFGYTPLNYMFALDYSHANYPVRAAAAELILQSSAEANLACLSNPFPPMQSKALHQSEHDLIYASGGVVKLRFLAVSLRVAEAYGCGPLSLAILSNNLRKVEHLVRTHPATLAERNLFGHTPLHLSVDKPKCLRVLVQAADTKLLNQTDIPGILGKSALETALYISGQLHCPAGDTHHRCRRCSCGECVVILLKADCALPVPAQLQGLLDHASQRCRLKYIRHVKDRRDRLKQLALDNLPTMEVERLGLAPGRTLDSLAPHVFQLLQHYKIQIPEALAVARTDPQSISSKLSPSSVYQALRRPEDAELFFRLGFHDTDSWHKDDAADLDDVYYDLPRDLSYLHWLATHGAMSCQLKSFESVRGIFTAHYIFSAIGKRVYYQKLLYSPGFDDKGTRIFPLTTWIHELNAAALPANNADACRCGCSLGGCTPLTSLLKGTHIRHVRRYHPNDEEDTYDTRPLSQLITSFTFYLTHFWGDLDIKHHTAALRYLTYTALGIPHSCCIPYSYKVWCFFERLKNIQEKYAYELELLEVLLTEFESELIAILQNPNLKIANLINFWKQTWARRMKEVVGHLKGSDLTDDERRGAEEIGVVWDNMATRLRWPPMQATLAPTPLSSITSSAPYCINLRSNLSYVFPFVNT